MEKEKYKVLSLDGGGVDRSKVGQFSTYGKNLMAKNLQSLAPNPLERGLELYNKYGLVPNAARVVGNIFGGIFGKDHPKDSKNAIWNVKSQLGNFGK